jgi:hypothetical protein
MAKKTDKEKLESLNFCIKTIKQSLKGEGSAEARAWAETQLAKWEKQRDKLIKKV